MVSVRSHPADEVDVGRGPGLSHPSFCLTEKIYIMKADTVIVGSVKTEVPEGRAPAGSTESELEAELEADHAPHYPEQETEPPLGSCTEVMFSVEEGGKEDHEPTTVSEK